MESDADLDMHNYFEMYMRKVTTCTEERDKKYNSDEETQFERRAMQVLLEMIKDRKAVVNDTFIKAILLEKGEARPKHEIHLLDFLHRKDGGGKLLVVIARTKLMGILECRAISEKISSVEYDDVVVEQAILLSNRKVSKVGRNELKLAIEKKNSTRRGATIHFLISSLLQFPFPRHELVPDHEILPAKDEERFLKRRFLKKKDMPIICRDDPIAVWYGMRTGQIVKIIRRFGGVCQETPFYRVVN